MNPTANGIEKIVEIVSKNTSGAIVLPANPSADSIAAATTLYLGLTKLGKNVSIACSIIPQSELLAADKIQTSLATAGNSLVISFPYVDGSIDKVDYNIQNGQFNLIISPRPNQQKLDPKKVKYTYAGGKTDFIITIDAPNLNALGQIYTDNQKIFQQKAIINIDRHLVNAFYGTANLVNKTSSSTSELVLKVLQALNSELDKEMATNLYTGIATATNNFTSYSVNADTFEVAAQLLKAGAVKKMQKTPTMATQPPMPPTPSFTEEQEDLDLEGTYEDEALLEDNLGDADADAPEDWLKPKIFKSGSGLV